MALCIVDTAYVIGPPRPFNTEFSNYRRYAFWAPVNTTYVKLTSSGAQPVNIFLRPECSTWLSLLVAGSWLPLLVVRGGCLGPPLRSPVLTGRFLKFKRHSFHLSMIYISKKKEISKFRRRGVLGGQNHEFQVLF